MSELEELEVGGMTCGDYRVVKYLGKGTYGLVALVTSPSGEAVAAKRSIKMVKMKSGTVPDYDFYAEVDLLKRFNHPNLMTADAYYVSGEESCAILPLADTDLAHYMRGEVPFSARVKVYQECCRGLVYLHANNVLHLDIKPQNILMKGTTPKLSDFGSAVTIAPGGRIPYTSEIVTRWWRAPELFYRLAGQGYQYGAEVDVWSMLMVGVELIFEAVPYGVEFGLTVADEHFPLWEVDRELLETIASYGCYLPPELEVEVLEIYGLQANYPGPSAERDLAAKFDQAVAASPEDRVTAAELLRLVGGSDSPVEIAYASAKIAYHGEFNPAAREKAFTILETWSPSAGRTMSKRAVMLSMDIFDRVSSVLNSVKEEVSLNLACASFLARVILGEEKSPRKYDTPGFPTHLRKVLEVLEFRIYRPDPTITMGLTEAAALELVKTSLSPGEILAYGS